MAEPTITNSQLLEGLWALGLSEAQLRAVPLRGKQRDFERHLADAGVTSEMVDKARQLVAWRPKEGVSQGEQLYQLIQLSGGGSKAFDDTLRQMMARPGLRGQGKDQLAEGDVIDAAKAVGIAAPVLTNALIKAGLGDRIASVGNLPAWNPFRGDTPDLAGVKADTGDILARATAPPPKPFDAPVWDKPKIDGTTPPPALPAGGAGEGAMSGAPGGGLLDTGMPTPATPEQIRARIQSQYGWAAALIDVPDVAKILDDAAAGRISVEEVDRRWKASDYYRTHTENQRQWAVFERTDPADARARVADKIATITNLAKTLGVANPDSARMEAIANNVLRLGWDDAAVRLAMTSELRYDPTGAQSGVFAMLKTASREMLVPLSDQAMTTWAQSIVGGTRTQEEFDGYIREQAKSMFPAMGTALDDPNMTARKYLDPYAQDTAKILGVNPTDIDWNDPKWGRAVNQIDPKTNQRTIMSRADWQRTLMADPTYGFDETANGKTQKAGLARSLLQTWGFSA